MNSSGEFICQPPQDRKLLKGAWSGLLSSPSQHLLTLLLGLWRVVCRQYCEVAEDPSVNPAWVWIPVSLLQQRSHILNTLLPCLLFLCSTWDLTLHIFTSFRLSPPLESAAWGQWLCRSCFSTTNPQPLEQYLTGSRHFIKYLLSEWMKGDAFCLLFVPEAVIFRYN